MENKGERMSRLFFAFKIGISLLTLKIMLVVISVSIMQFSYADQVKELYWEDMVPKTYVVPPVDINHNGNMSQVEPNAPLVEALNGQYVKIPGFVVPLTGDSDNITEFLLVPYFGACVHVPPPPSNQIVYVKFSDGVPITNLYDAVWVTGLLSTEGWQGDIASVGYTLSGEAVSDFDE